MPTCYIIAGPNGAGKTTFATEFLPQIRVIPFVNPDLIAKGLSPFDSQMVAAEAGRLVLDRIRSLSSRREDFAFETTLSGRGYLRVIRRLRRSGYRIRLLYLWIPTPALALARIAERVREGGHDVPREDVVRRMTRSLRNLFDLYLPLVNTVWLLDNSSTHAARFVAALAGKRRRIFDEAAYRAILGSK